MSVDRVLLRDQFKYKDGENVEQILTDGNNIFSISRKGTIYKWDRFGNCKKFVKRFKSDCITLFKDTIMVGREKGIIDVYDFSGELLREIHTKKDSYVSIILMHEPYMFVGYSNGNVYMFTFAHNKEPKEVKALNLSNLINHITCMIVIENTIFITSDTGIILSINLEDNTYKQFIHCNGRVNKIIEHNGLLYTCGHYKYIKCWDKNTKYIKTLPSLRECVCDIISHNTYLYAQGSFGEIMVWDKNDKCIKVIGGNNFPECFNIFKNNIYIGFNEGSLQMYGEYFHYHYKYLPNTQKYKLKNWFAYYGLKYPRINETIILLICRELLA